jgi:hypothetical protein
MLKCSICFLETFFLEENKESDGIFVNISFVEMESSKLTNYSTNMCWSDEGTMLELCYFYIVHLFLWCQFHHVGLGFAHANNGSPMFKIVTMRQMDWVMKNLNAISRVGYCLKKWNRFCCIWKKSLQSGKYLNPQILISCAIDITMVMTKACNMTPLWSNKSKSHDNPEISRLTIIND